MRGAIHGQHFVDHDAAGQGRVDGPGLGRRFGFVLPDIGKVQTDGLDGVRTVRQTAEHYRRIDRQLGAPKTAIEAPLEVRVVGSAKGERGAGCGGYRSRFAVDGHAGRDHRAHILAVGSAAEPGHEAEIAIGRVGHATVFGHVAEAVDVIFFRDGGSIDGQVGSARNAFEVDRGVDDDVPVDQSSASGDAPAGADEVEERMDHVDDRVVDEGHEGLFLDLGHMVDVVELVADHHVVMAHQMAIAGGDGVGVTASRVPLILADIQEGVAFDIGIALEVERVVAAPVEHVVDDHQVITGAACSDNPVDVDHIVMALVQAEVVAF